MSNWKVKTQHLVLITMIISVLVYGITRLIFTIIYASDYTSMEIIISCALLFAELFMLTHSLGYGTHLIKALYAKDIAEEKIPDLPVPPPTVAILVAARHEPKEVLEQTFRSLTNLRYPAKKIYFLDDSSDEKYKKEAEDICKKFEINLFRRKDRHGAKAGIINDCLRTKITEKYVAIFDADQNPMPSFLTPLIPMLEGKPDVAFVQTPQFYHNTDRKTNPVSFGAGKQQAVFYEYICESKGIKESMFCCGTNVVFRREALMSVGGFDEAYITEDMATSVKLHIAGWKSLYYNHVGTFGMGPEALSEYFKQQARWSRGSFGVLRKVIASFIKNPTSMTINQWIEYVLSGSYYLVGVAFFIYIIFDIPSFFIKPDIYITVFVPYFALSMGVFYITLRQRNYRMQDLFIGQMLTCITFPVYMKSAFLGLLGMQGSFGITLKGKTKCMPYIYLWPQITMILLNFVALVWGLNRFYYERNFSVLVNCFWVTYHFLIMSSIFYFNVECKEPENEKNK
jgi:cellulose synthase (UDP-forming)